LFGRGRILALLLAWAPLAQPSDGLRLQQADGSELRLAEPVARIVTLAPHLTEGVFAAGAGEQVVATVEYSEFPAAAAHIPRIGDAFRLDIERIVALHPDLVIAWDSGNPRPAVEQLRQLGLPVWSVEIREPRDIPTFIESVGRISGHVAEADAAGHRLRTRLVDLERRYAGVKTLRYFYQVDAKPLFTINGQHLISQGLALCGGVNIFASEPGLAFQVARESVIVANPDAMLAPRLPGAADPLAGWQAWPALAAVQRGALFLLPADEISRATPRFLDSLDQACKLLQVLRGNPDD
jgi:iron complex transport system substrate-binding protein